MRLFIIFFKTVFIVLQEILNPLTVKNLFERISDEVLYNKLITIILDNFL